MKKSSVITFLLLLFLQRCFADEFQIIAMNGQSILIGHRTCMVNSIFNSNEEIHWDKSDVTLIAAINVKNPEMTCFFSPIDTHNRKESQSLNYFQRLVRKLVRHFVNIKKTSTREIDIYDVEIALTEREFFLADTIRIRTNELNNNSDRNYFASFIQNSIKHIVPLRVENGDLVFERSAFIEGGTIPPKKYIMSIYYIEKDYYHEITHGAIITIL